MKPLQKAVYLLLFAYLAIAALIHAKTFLVPLAFAGLLAMLMLPVMRWLQRRGIHKVLAIVLCILSIMSVVAGIVALVSWQVSDLASNADEIERNLNQKVTQAREYITNNLGISEKQQDEVIRQQQESNPVKFGALITSALSGIGGFMTGFILVIVYLFLFLYSHNHLKQFVMKLVNKNEEKEADRTLGEASLVTQKYLTGMALMIGSLWVMYGIGFSIVGIRHALFFAILCGLLEIVPFIGNLVGNLITVLMTLAQGGSMNMVIGILITYAIVQFIQTYFLETLVVGKEVSINPLFTIAGLVAGEMIWGIIGMILAIPVMGMIKIVCDHVDSLKPVSFLIGTGPSPNSSVRRKTGRGKTANNE